MPRELTVDALDASILDLAEKWNYICRELCMFVDSKLFEVFSGLTAAA
jgi:hypothetical protein